MLLDVVINGDHPQAKRPGMCHERVIERQADRQKRGVEQRDEMFDGPRGASHCICSIVRGPALWLAHGGGLPEVAPVGSSRLVCCHSRTAAITRSTSASESCG